MIFLNHQLVWISLPNQSQSNSNKPNPPYWPALIQKSTLNNYYVKLFNPPTDTNPQINIQYSQHNIKDYQYHRIHFASGYQQNQKFMYAVQLADIQLDNQKQSHHNQSRKKEQISKNNNHINNKKTVSVINFQKKLQNLIMYILQQQNDVQKQNQQQQGQEKKIMKIVQQHRTLNFNGQQYIRSRIPRMFNYLVKYLKKKKLNELAIKNVQLQLAKIRQSINQSVFGTIKL